MIGDRHTREADPTESLVEEEPRQDGGRDRVERRDDDGHREVAHVVRHDEEQVPAEVAETRDHGHADPPARAWCAAGIRRAATSASATMLMLTTPPTLTMKSGHQIPAPASCDRSIVRKKLAKPSPATTISASSRRREPPIVGMEGPSARFSGSVMRSTATSAARHPGQDGRIGGLATREPDDRRDRRRDERGQRRDQSHRAARQGEIEAAHPERARDAGDGPEGERLAAGHRFARDQQQDDRDDETGGLRDPARDERVAQASGDAAAEIAGSPGHGGQEREERASQGQTVPSSPPSAATATPSAAGSGQRDGSGSGAAGGSGSTGGSGAMGIATMVGPSSTTTLSARPS